MTELVTTIAELLQRRSAMSGRIVLVPTMGALHDGHLTLIRRAQELADTVVVSNFVNPLQFGPGEDYDRYPRDIDGDLSKIEGYADVMFAPSANEIYPDLPPFQIDVGALGDDFEGKFRPGHFSGVATVVLKLFQLVRPDIAIFGEKDAQQLAIIRRLVRDFHVPVQIEAVGINRDDSGLARSSRNAYLDSDGAQKALVLHDVVQRAQAVATAKELTQLLESCRDADGVTWDYRAAVDPVTLTRIADDYVGEVLVLLCARVQGVRLLDNTRVTVGRAR